MERLLNIVYQGGTHGHFLRFYIDKHSKLSPAIEGTPFTEIGTSHNDSKCSNMVYEYHPVEHTHYKNTDEPHILITVDEQDLLILERSVTIRAGNFDIDTNLDQIRVDKRFANLFTWSKKFSELYGIDADKESIPRFLMRDFYKMSFLDVKKSGYIELDKKLKNSKPANCFELPVSHFWNKDKLLETLNDINNKFNLSLDFSDTSIIDEFQQRMPVLKTRNRANNIIDSIINKQDIDISNIDTVEQAYISAWIEKNNDYVVTPLSNYFFTTTGEILEWLAKYPQHYKAMNPNLPKFNGIPNPYYLANLKK